MEHKQCKPISHNPFERLQYIHLRIPITEQFFDQKWNSLFQLLILLPKLHSKQKAIKKLTAD